MMDLEKKALEYATLMHKGTYRKGNDKELYINHPVRVAEYVKYYKSNSRGIKYLIAASYLHDVLEDTKATFNDLMDKFGSEVAYLVLELTSVRDFKYELGKEKYLAIKLKNMSSWALDIKLCDRLDNISDLEDVNEAFRLKYIHETRYVIFYLLNNRKLTKTHLKIINDITKILQYYTEKGLDTPKQKTIGSLAS